MLRKYGGVEIIGRIPHYFENRFIKIYKGVPSQFLGDLCPFKVGTGLAAIDKALSRTRRTGCNWSIRVDGREASHGQYQAILIVNEFLGPDLPFSADSLGSGRLHLFAIRDLGSFRIPFQASKALSGDIMQDPARYGLYPTAYESNWRSFPILDSSSRLMSMDRRCFASARHVFRS